MRVTMDNIYKTWTNIIRYCVSRHDQKVLMFEVLVVFRENELHTCILREYIYI